MVPCGWERYSCSFFFLKIHFYLFILFILAAPGLSCGTRDLCCRMQDFLVAGCRIF